MSMVHRFANWLETHWVIPAYSGGVLAAFAICFLGSAINTMAGWLYVISGISFALLGIAAALPVRSLKEIRVHRLPIQPVSAGEQITVELELQNHSSQPKTLLQFQDMIPFVLGQPVEGVIESIPAHETYHWVYSQPTERRGVYRWHTLQLRTGTPLGLFWCRRQRDVLATAIVYPTVLPLTICPLVDAMGQEDSPQFYSRDRRSQTAHENVTRSLRPYRWGDSIRLVHWRTSARYNELRVRELEVFTGGQDIVICLDSASNWQPDHFEQAVIATASIYFYACRCQLNARLWTAGSGLLHGNLVVLEALASVNPTEETSATLPPNQPLIWLTQNPVTISSLPTGSRWVLWPSNSSTSQQNPQTGESPGIVIQPEKPLQSQLEAYLR